MKSAFAEILGLLRRNSGLSQRRVAADLGISQALLSHYENDARIPKLEFVVRVCDYYSVTADYILGRIDEPITSMLPAPRDCENAPRLIAAANAVFTMLEKLSDPELYAAAVDFLVIPTENVAALLNNPDTLYDPSRDAELKLAEATLLTRARHKNGSTVSPGGAAAEKLKLET